jgi:glycosyltransferase involved in cell wall biosynthesis
MKSKDISIAQSSLLKEITEYGKVFERVVLIYFHKKYSDRTLNDNVEIITLPYIEPKSSLMFAISILASYFISIPILLRVILKYKINLVRADDVVTSGLPCVLVSKILQVRSVVCLLGDVEDVIRYKIGVKSRFLKLVIPLVRKIERFVISNSDGSIVVAKNLQDTAKNFGSKRSFLTYPNMDLSIFGPRTEFYTAKTNLTVLYVGRLEPEKGPLNVLKVAEILKDVNFVIVGYGSLELEIRKIINEKKIANVELLGLVDHSELPKLYREADIFLLPSYSEGLPVVMIEAMTSELPVIVSNVGAVNEVLQGNNGGFVVSIGNTEEIVSKIKILRDPNLRRDLGRKGRINVLSRFGNYIGAQVSIYTKLVNVDSQVP